jgi:hypothetical protein
MSDGHRQGIFVEYGQGPSRKTYGPDETADLIADLIARVTALEAMIMELAPLSATIYFVLPTVPLSVDPTEEYVDAGATNSESEVVLAVWNVVLGRVPISVFVDLFWTAELDAPGVGSTRMMISTGNEVVGAAPSASAYAISNTFVELENEVSGPVIPPTSETFSIILTGFVNDGAIQLTTHASAASRVKATF